MVDLLIHQGAIYSGQSWINPGYLVIQDQEISQISPGEAPEDLVRSASRVISAKNQAVIPGLTNGHTHLSQVFMRGLAGGRALIPWLKEVIWPLQAALTPADMHLAAMLGLVENLRCGATNVVDHHKLTKTADYTDLVLAAAEKIGLHFRLARSWADKGTGAEDPQKIISDLTRLLEKWRGHTQIQIDNGPLALWRCSEDSLRETHNLALEYGRKTHFHVSETREELQKSLDEYQLRPVEWLSRIGVLDTETEIVHAVWVDENETDLISSAGAVIVHCPVSNAVLGSGAAPVASFLEKGIDLRLGTDGPASNDTQDLWETGKAALSMARIKNLDPTLLPPDLMLKIALAGKSLESGGEADVVIVNLNHPRVCPVQDLSSALVLGTHGSDVETVIVAGKILMENQKVLVIDEEELLNSCNQAATQLRKRAGLDQ